MKNGEVNNGCCEPFAVDLRDLAGVVLTIVNVKKHARYGYGDSGYYYGRNRKYYVS